VTEIRALRNEGPKPPAVTAKSGCPIKHDSGWLVPRWIYATKGRWGWLILTKFLRVCLNRLGWAKIEKGALFEALLFNVMTVLLLRTAAW